MGLLIERSGADFLRTYGKKSAAKSKIPASKYEPGAPGGEKKFDCKTQVQTQMRTWGTRCGRHCFLAFSVGGSLFFFLRARALAILLVAL
jgi:hypothetical protein